ncbi:MAG TPA: M50 family metallopeptidase [Kofleriaceae bacterium]|nr:M50 family metallopeptidase [Kofleriaceae bacterium]
MYILLALLSLGFLIVVHEGGHYFVARWCKMRVERFSIGFGPGILKRTSKKSGTVFQIAPIPFGGFVEIRGMNIAEEIDPDDKLAYPNRPAWQRFMTIFAGPATNYLSAVVLAFALYTCHGQESSWRWYDVASVRDDYDAQGKLQRGDRILAVDGEAILAEGEYVGPDGKRLHSDALGLVGRVTAKKGAPVTLTVRRHGQLQQISITPKLVFRDLPNDTTPRYLLGIVPVDQPDVIDIGVIGAAREAVIYPIDTTARIAVGLYEIITRKAPADPGGPTRIVQEFTRAWKLGPVTGISLLMLLSVYLGLFNLLPLPALDGGRLVFLTYELVTRRRANPKIEAMVHMGGIMVLGVVMILVTLRDCHLI